MRAPFWIASEDSPPASETQVVALTRFLRTGERIKMTKKSGEVLEKDQANTAGVSTRISASQAHALDVIARIKGMKKADVIRLALDEFIERYTSPKAVEELADEMRARMLREAEEAARQLSRG